MTAAPVPTPVPTIPRRARPPPAPAPTGGAAPWPHHRHRNRTGQCLQCARRRNRSAFRTCRPSCPAPWPKPARRQARRHLGGGPGRQRAGGLCDDRRAGQRHHPPPPPIAANNTDLQGLSVPAAGAAIAKAITGAYLSSGGNAFSTRTASEIVQQIFPPAPRSRPGLESGPLFGVQFSQLPCSDLSPRFSAGGRRRRLDRAQALAARAWPPIPGGFPLYKNGVLVGGVGVMADGDYGFDPDVSNTDNDVDEKIALAGHHRLSPRPPPSPPTRSASDGTSLRYSDASAVDPEVQSRLARPPSPPLAGRRRPGGGDRLLSERRRRWPGQVYGSEASGIRQATDRRVQQSRRLHPDQRRRAQPLSRHAPAAMPPMSARPLTAAEVQRRAGGSLQDHEPRPRRRSASRWTAAPRCRSRWSTPMARSLGAGARARRADLRHRRVAAEGAHRGVLLRRQRRRRT